MAMPDTLASQLLRPGLLEGVDMLLAAAHTPDPGSAGAAIADACAGLGARVWLCEAGEPPSGELPSGELPSGEEEQARMDAAVERALSAGGKVDVLVVDGGALFASAAGAPGAAASPRAAGQKPERSALGACLEGAWSVTRAVVAGAFLAAERGGRIVYVAPAIGSGEHAGAARAGLENLARTLSVEWARHGITVVAIAPGSPTSAGEVAALTAYLASPAGAYFSGCLLDLSGPV